MSEAEGKGFEISRSALKLRAKVPNLDQAKFAEFAKTLKRTARSLRSLTPRSRWTRSSHKSVAEAQEVIDVASRAPELIDPIRSVGNQAAAGD
jgi:hypothetical protein